MATVNPVQSTEFDLADAENPISFGAGTRIIATSGEGVFGDASAVWTVDNSGVITAVNSFDVGVLLQGGGGFTNLTGGNVYGGSVGVDMWGGNVTNNSGATITGGSFVGVYLDGAGTLVNGGSIDSIADKGVKLAYGGEVDNLVTGRISGADRSIYIVGGVGTVNNAGVLGGGTHTAVSLIAGGSVTNSGSIEGSVNINNAIGGVDNLEGGMIAGGSFGVILEAGGEVGNAGAITGADGVIATNDSVYVTNTGSVIGTTIEAISSNGTNATLGVGIWLAALGTVKNSLSGGITGASYGVDLSTGGTVIDAGAIVGNSGTAVVFGGTGSNLLALAPSYSFSGLVVGGLNASNTLELTSTVSVGTVAGLGTEFVDFGSVVFDAGARWSVAGDVSGLAGPISGFAVGDTIEINGVTATGSNYAGGILTLSESDGSVTLDLPGSFNTGSFNVTDIAGGTAISLAAACFASGAHIATVDGDVTVDSLRVGDSVLAHFGDGRKRPSAVVWLGHRTLKVRRHPAPQDVWPIRVAAGAFAVEQPQRDLFLSPDHAVFTGGVLIPIRYLLNGRTVVQEPRDEITYWHVELERHGVLLAENLPCESYLDTGNRAAFANGGTVVEMQPDFALQVWQTEACARLVRGGEQLAQQRQVLLNRARALGHVTTSNPGIKARADGRPVKVERDGKLARVLLPAGTRTVRLLSRTWIPAHMHPGSTDTRRLGIAIGGIWLDGSEASLASSALGAGWHAAESDWRWTDGDAVLAVAGARELLFAVAMSGLYWRGGPARQNSMRPTEGRLAMLA